MAYQFNAAIATQTVVFRGTSSVRAKLANVNLPSVRALQTAVYTLDVVGGVSGSFGATVLGRVGGSTGSTIALAGVTAISAAGAYVLFPYGYSVSGKGTLGDAVSIVNRVDQVIPPSEVIFQSGIATAGISASCTVNACFQAPR